MQYESSKLLLVKNTQAQSDWHKCTHCHTIHIIYGLILLTQKRKYYPGMVTDLDYYHVFLDNECSNFAKHNFIVNYTRDWSF